ncbi:MAG: uncharacterized protein QOJ20_2987 [Mycobacterium sp.]|jgi:hypothetical protein|nr:uncharacterized protein [Mycobacterium sp.]
MFPKRTASAPRIAPTRLMIVGDGDVVCPTDLGLDAFNRAREPKRLELYPGGHFSAYTDQFERAADAAAEWFTHRPSFRETITRMTEITRVFPLREHGGWAHAVGWSDVAQLRR